MSDVNDQQPPKIEFPCEYPIKVIGDGGPDFKDFVLRTVRVHAPDIALDRVEVNASRSGKYLSIRLWIMATGEEQLMCIFRDLKDSGRVQMVL